MNGLSRIMFNFKWRLFRLNNDISVSLVPIVLLQGTPFDLEVSLWYPGQPDDEGSNDVSSLIHIALLFDGDIWGLSDDAARESYEFVCEQYDALK